MRVHLIGTGTAVPDPEHSQTCTFISTGDGRSAIVIDLGGGAVNRIPGWDRVAGYFFTHDHPDHTGGLDQLIQSHLFGRMDVPLDDVPPPLRLFGPASVHELLDEIRVRHFSGEKSRERLEGSLRWQTIMDGVSVGSVKGFEIGCYDSAHTRDSLSLRIAADGRILALTSDASTAGRLDEVLDGADLAVMECSLPPGIEMPSHLNGEQIGRILGNLGERAPKRIILTHLYPPALDSMEEILKSLPSGHRGRTQFARDGQEADV